MVSVSSIFFSFLVGKKKHRFVQKIFAKHFPPKKRDLLEVAAIPSHTSVSVVCGGDGYSVAEIATWDPGSQSETSPWSTISWAPAHRKNPKNPSVSRLEKARYPKNSDGTQNDRMVLHWIYLAQLMLKFSAESKKWCDQKEQELVKPRKSWSSWLLFFVLRLLRWCEGQRNMHDTHWYPRSWSSLMKRSNITLSNPILAADQFDTWWLQPPRLLLQSETVSSMPAAKGRQVMM